MDKGPVTLHSVVDKVGCLESRSLGCVWAAASASCWVMGACHSSTPLSTRKPTCLIWKVVLCRAEAIALLRFWPVRAAQRKCNGGKPAQCDLWIRAVEPSVQHVYHSKSCLERTTRKRMNIISATLCPESAAGLSRGPSREWTLKRKGFSSTRRTEILPVLMLGWGPALANLQTYYRTHVFHWLHPPWNQNPHCRAAETMVLPHYPLFLLPAKKKVCLES